MTLTNENDLTIRKKLEGMQVLTYAPEPQASALCSGAPPGPEPPKPLAMDKGAYKGGGFGMVGFARPNFKFSFPCPSAAPGAVLGAYAAYEGLKANAGFSAVKGGGPAQGVLGPESRPFAILTGGGSVVAGRPTPPPMGSPQHGAAGPESRFAPHKAGSVTPPPILGNVAVVADCKQVSHVECASGLGDWVVRGKRTFPRPPEIETTAESCLNPLGETPGGVAALGGVPGQPSNGLPDTPCRPQPATW
ncbi:hypothetical protein M569_17674 [Genlisea aurea]|uniref:Uncharacterized protein n=1 Tax=Genlisea aurea TaxID=192259 RepID=S8DCR1_9LAMI|nr:hypothetical protein M569_17674 [Genlisea aurea]